MMQVLKAHVPLEVSPKSLWEYKCKPGSKKPGLQWRYVMKMRPLLSDLLDASGGRVLRQVRFHAQLRSFLLSKGLVWATADSEAPCYRVRMVMSGLLNFKTQSVRSRKRLPEKFGELQTLLDKMRASDDEGEGLERGDEGSSCDEVEHEQAGPQALVDVSSTEEEACSPAVKNCIVEEKGVDELFVKAEWFVSIPDHRYSHGIKTAIHEFLTKATMEDTRISSIINFECGMVGPYAENVTIAGNAYTKSGFDPILQNTSDDASTS